MRILLIVLIILIAVGAGFFVLQTVQPESQSASITQESPEIEADNVLVARQSIAVGTTITEEMLDQQPWPRHLVLDGFIVSGSPEANIIGMVARSEFQQQEPISRYKLANLNDANFIAAALPEGMRALTLEVNTISGVAGYIFPGDRIDIIMTHGIPDALALQDSTAVAPRSATESGFAETILSDIKVLAIEIRGLGAYKNSAEQEQEPQAPTNITLELTPEQAQAVRLAESNGSISLALRSLKDGGSEIVPATKLEDLTKAEMADKQQQQGGVHIIRGVGVDAAASRPSAGFNPSQIPFN